MCLFIRKIINKIFHLGADPSLSPSSVDPIAEECSALLKDLCTAIEEANALLRDRNKYTDVTYSDLWLERYNHLIPKLSGKALWRYKKCSEKNELESKAKIFFSILGTLKDNIRKHNDDLARRQIPEAYDLIGEVEGRRLDEQQMISVVKPSKNTIVLAGAGTGKTTTIVGKIKYVLKKGMYQENEILVLSFTKASATEMSERIHEETKCPISASTFHKLGMEIIKQVEGKVPKIYSKSISSFVKKELEGLVKDPDYLNRLCKYALYYRNGGRDRSDFSSEREYQEYLRSNAPLTLQGETVKSYGELDIANFLYENQIRYEYEASYKFDTNNEEYGQYHPDFYLPDYDLYIEYFGTDRSGNVADYFRGREGMSAAEAYRAGIEWKRKIHAEKQTSMLELYAYEKYEGTLLERLKTQLESKNVKGEPLPPEKLWKVINEKNNSFFDGITELFSTIISLIKSNNYSFEQVEQRASKYQDSRNNLFLLGLIKPICEAYDHMLKENGEIDFSDMINRAAKYIRDGKYVNPYKFVIVDEYQDISKARFGLLQELRRSAPYDLFCVGDDWQSIYRFAGSDINYIVDFEKYWGSSELGRIETTYRFTNSLIAISSGFVMQNPRQLKKEIRGKSIDPIFSLGIISGNSNRDIRKQLVEELKTLPKGASVFLLGRYSFDVGILNGYSYEFDFVPFGLEVRYDNASSKIIVTSTERPDLKMEFLTAHKSKGLQADYVFILNNKDSKMGFPSKIQDASIIDLLLEKAEPYPFAEERRLFYVALTRAKKKVYLLTINQNESVFAEELMSKYSNELEIKKCPLCGGNLVRRRGKNGSFWGCSNYGKTGCGYMEKSIQENDSQTNVVRRSGTLE